MQNHFQQKETMNPREKQHMLGIAEMDEQHKYLYSLFDKIERGATIRNQAKTAQLLDEIQGYVLFHFASEEHLIRLYKAPGFAVHQTDHEMAGNKLVQFLDDFDAGRLNPDRLRIFLTGWLMEHSSTSDELYAAHIRTIRSSQ